MRFPFLARDEDGTIDAESSCMRLTPSLLVCAFLALAPDQRASAAEACPPAQPVERLELQIESVTVGGFSESDLSTYRRYETSFVADKGGARWSLVTVPLADSKASIADEYHAN